MHVQYDAGTDTEFLWSMPNDIPNVAPEFLFAFPVYNDAGTYYAPHAHEYNELVLIQSGRFRSRVGAQEHIAVLNDILLYPSNTCHEEWAEDNKPVVTWACAFNWDGYKQGESISCHDTDGKVQQLVAELAAVHFRRKIRAPGDHEEKCRLFLTQVLTEIDRLRSEGPHAVVEKARAYIRSNLDKSLTVDDVAATVGLSRCHFSRMYRATTGHTPWNDIQRLRMEEAQRLITSTTLPLHAIAPKVGIANEYHLSRLLKTVLGTSVRKLRQ